MTAYAPSDVMSITVPRDSGGCGKTHVREGEGKLSVDCAGCEAHIFGALSRHGWSADPATVALTPDELATVEAQTQAAGMGSNLQIAQALAQIATALAGSGLSAVPSTPADLVNGMSAAELDALARQIAARKASLKKTTPEG